MARRARPDEAAQLAAQIDAFSERTGLVPRPLCSAVKHRWLRTHHPDTARAVRRLNVAEWVVRRLGGDELAELSLASRTGWLDIHTRTWWEETLAWSGASVRAASRTGAGRHARRHRARRAAACARSGARDRGARSPERGGRRRGVGDGDVLDSCGTAEALIRATAPLSPERVRDAVSIRINVGWHAVPGRQCLLGSARTGRCSSA